MVVINIPYYVIKVDATLRSQEEAEFQLMRFWAPSCYSLRAKEMSESARIHSGLSSVWTNTVTVNILTSQDLSRDSL